jgi:hypothetical protein
MRSAMMFDAPIKYLLFIDNKLPDTMEKSYIYRIHRSGSVVDK